MLWRPEPAGTGIVTELLHRRNILARPGRRGQPRPLAANLDRIVVVLAPRPMLQETLIDRYLVAAEHFRIPVLLVLNKVDLLSAPERQGLTERLSSYTRIGYALCRCSTRAVGGLAELAARLRDGASILVGQSGVGKSSLVKALAPERHVAIAEINARTELGRHTTSTSTLYHLPGGGDLVDSPGVRDFGLWHIPREAIQHGFRELAEHARGCRYRDCRHLDEPGCAVRAAVAHGEIETRRLASYQAILGDAAGGW